MKGKGGAAAGRAAAASTLVVEAAQDTATEARPKRKLVPSTRLPAGEEALSAKLEQARQNSKKAVVPRAGRSGIGGKAATAKQRGGGSNEEVKNDTMDEVVTRWEVPGGCCA